MAETGVGRGWVLLALYQDTQGSTAVVWTRPAARWVAVMP